TARATAIERRGPPRAAVPGSRVVPRQIRDQRFEIVVAQLGRPEKRHRQIPVADDGFDVRGREVGAPLELGPQLAAIAVLKSARARHRRYEQRTEDLVGKRAVTRAAALIEDL